MTAPQPILARMRSYADLHAMLRARAHQLNIARIEIDRRAKFPEGYSAKLLGPRPRKRFGAKSIASLLEVLGIELIAVERSDWVRIDGKRDTANVRMLSVTKPYHKTRRFLRRIARKGGNARAAMLSANQRHKIARRAAKARWDKAPIRVKPQPPAEPTSAPP